MNNKLACTPFKPLICVVLCLLLAACVPTVQRFYQTPKVTGHVLDLTTLEPVAGVQVSHWEYPQPVVTSDARGGFVLPSVSQIKATLLMPGHALKDYPVRIVAEASTTQVMAQATLLMRSEETVFVGDVMIDSEPEIIVPSPTPGNNEYAQLMHLLDANTQCDKAVGAAAAGTLNSARKLRGHLQKSPASIQLQGLTSDSYYRVHEMWRYWLITCDWSGITSIQRRDTVMDVRELMAELAAEAPES